MDEKHVRDQVRQHLSQVALEFEEAAAAARRAAAILDDRSQAWTQVQQMYARLGQANHLVGEFQRVIDDATRIASGPMK